MGLQQNLQDIQTNLLAAKTAIAQSISHKGVECSADDKLSTFAEKIDSITTGSTGGTGNKIMLTNGTKFAYSKAFEPELYDTSNVTDMYMMFHSATTLTTLDLSSWNTSKVTTMENMFNVCEAISYLDISNFNTSNVTSMKYMFNSGTSLETLDLSHFNTSKVTTMENMFSVCSGLTDLDLSSFDLTNVTNMTNMFWSCTSLTNLQLNDLGHNQSCTSLDLTHCSALTKDSILYLFNNAFDRSAAEYTKAFTIKLNATTKALLTEDEIAIATNKGFTVA